MDEDVSIELLSKDHLGFFKELITLFQEVFEHENTTKQTDFYLEKLLSKPDFIVYVVLMNQKVIGGLTAYEIKKYYSETSEYFIYDIAVKPEFKRKGLGKALLSSLKKDGIEKGIHEIFVAAHEEDKGAVQFYTGTGGEPEKVVHFNFYNQID